jgi:hypothetical protein
LMMSEFLLHVSILLAGKILVLGYTLGKYYELSICHGL